MLSLALAAEEHTIELNKRSPKKKAKKTGKTNTKATKKAKANSCLLKRDGVTLHRRTTCRQEAEAAIGTGLGPMGQINENLAALAALQGAGEKADGPPADKPEAQPARRVHQNEAELKIEEDDLLKTDQRRDKMHPWADARKGPNAKLVQQSELDREHYDNPNNMKYGTDSKQTDAAVMGTEIEFSN
jgi:hypothetical protein